MSTKLEITLSKAVLRKLEHYARTQNSNVHEMVENYLNAVAARINTDRLNEALPSQRAGRPSSDALMGNFPG